MKKKIKLKRTLCVLTAGMMVMSVGTGCKGKNGGGNDPVSAQLMSSMAFDTKQIELNESLNTGIIKKNDLFYSTMTEYHFGSDDSYLSTSYIVAFDENAVIKTVIPVYEQKNQDEYGYINGNIMVDDSGNISCILDVSSYDENGNYTDKSQLLTFDPSGTQISSIDFGNIVTEEDSNANRYFQGLVVAPDGNIYCNLGSCVRVLDSTGKVLFTTKDIDDNSGWLSSMVITNAGKAAVVKYEYTDTTSTTKLVEIDAAAQDFGAEHIFKAGFNSAFNGSGDYLVYTSSDTGIMGVRADTMEPEQVVNTLSLGLDSNSNNFYVCDDGSFLMGSYDWSDDSSKVVLTILTPSENSAAKDKKIINLGCFYLDWSVRSLIAEFNRESSEYVINVQSFSDTNDTSDWANAVSAFNNQLLSGKVPDIISVDSSMPVDSYISKGLFADLYPVMEEDGELTRDMMMPNVLTALERDGKLPYISPGFYVTGYAGKSSVVGPVDEFTVARSQEIAKSMGDDVSVFNLYLTRNEYLSSALSYNNFVNYETATCDFDNDNFKAVLEAAKEYPEGIDYDKLYNENPNYWSDQEKAVYDNKALLQSVYLYSFDRYNTLKKTYFAGDEMTFVGFPHAGDDYATSQLNFDIILGISEKSNVKDGAWDFIKKVLTSTVTEEETKYYDYNSAPENVEFVPEVGGVLTPAEGSSRYKLVASEMSYWNNYGNFPIVRADLEKLAQQALVPSKYVNENGELVESENTSYIGDEEIKISQMTQEDVDECMALIESCTSVSHTNEDLQAIIDEEASAYFAGTKSVDETAKTIQSRASIFMSEQYG